MLVQDLLVLSLYLGHQLFISSTWTKALLVGGIFTFSLTIFPLAVLFVQTILIPRRLVSVTNTGKQATGFLGKPLFFPVQFNHIRRRPVKDQFLNRFLLVGTPVGLRCRIGSLLAVDDKSLDVTPPPDGVERYWSWKRISSQLSCWFTVDSARFLHRGDHGLDLRQKLDNFLRDQNEDPSQWPFAYLLCVPQFLGWSRAVVSWWYLYNKNRELDAMILEINNSYWEKRNIFLRVTPTSDYPLCPPADLPVEYLDELHLAPSLISRPRAKFYKGTWIKSIFASPFEKVDGLVSNRMMDPLQPEAWKSNTSFSNMTTMEEDTGEVRMATRLICDGPPLDPTRMTAFQVAKFVFNWTLPNMFTTAEIVYKALKIKFTGMMIMNKKPPVRSGTVGRPITKLEMVFEGFFRSYLATCVENFPEPIEVTYLPCRSFTNEIVRMQSPLYKDAPSNAHSLRVEPVDPQFYVRFATYLDVESALGQETQPAGLIADPTAQPLLASDLSLLAYVLESGSKTNNSTSASNWKMRLIFSWCRGSGLTFMDNFSMSSSNLPPRATYLAATLRIASARKIAFGSQSLLSIWIFIASWLVRYLVLKALFAWCDTVSVTGKTSIMLATAGYLLAMSALESIKSWLLQI
ncbi:hypothetical protein N7462_001180 [Penicillium macrosclerotiorum]|uniref:uncharacterized protein n=1 Tax=Penicillium macrosclerotiorum TaxID=303699 RepID=UPI002546B9EB|nr:uncharacterized protein N7462_001180 [Penicillium macrosclerotiorum]KAJ5691757.1 hypothetical protein N7462_001180 [Penicillium macrosclerotiorum]